MEKKYIGNDSISMELIIEIRINFNMEISLPVTENKVHFTTSYTK